MRYLEIVCLLFIPNVIQKLKIPMLLWKLCLIFICFFNISLCAGELDELWIFESNFIKLGKKDTYEKFKKGFLKTIFNKNTAFSLYAYEDLEGLQYLYLINVGKFDALEDFFIRNDYLQKLPPQKFLPFASTLNFNIRVLNSYLTACSFVLEGKEDLLNYPLAYFYVFTIDPVNARDLEAHLNTLAQKQRNSEQGACFRTWKGLLGEELPKYIVAVFGMSEKEIESLELFTQDVKPALRKQNIQKVKLRKDLSVIAK